MGRFGRVRDVGGVVPPCGEGEKLLDVEQSEGRPRGEIKSGL